MIIISQSLCERIYEVIDSNKRVGRLPVDIAKFKRYCATINTLNSLDRRTSNYLGEPLSSYELPKFLKILIGPGSITISGGSMEKDLKVYQVYGEEQELEVSPLSCTEFYGVTQALKGAFKNNGEAGPTFETRADKTLSTLASSLSFEGRVQVQSDPTVPHAISFDPYLTGVAGYNAGDMLIARLRIEMHGYLNNKEASPIVG